MNRFATLLRREWLQHQRGWLILLALPFVLFVLAGTFGDVHIGDAADIAEAAPGPLALTLLVTVGLTALTILLSVGAALLQAPGLARRDVQDRSIEFWLSLPTGHVPSIGATLLMHLLALPWAAVFAGLAGGLVVSPIIVGRVYGLGEWAALPWGQILLVMAALALRLAFGLTLAALWLSPLILGTMAASAWLKRWGVPVVVGSLFFGHQLASRVYGITLIGDTLRYLGEQAGQALFEGVKASQTHGIRIVHPDQLGDVLPKGAAVLITDAGNAMLALASTGFVAALAAGIAAFGLLVLRRQRGA